MADRQYLTQLGAPTVDKAFSGLRTITRSYAVNGQGTAQAQIETEVFLAYGTADAEFTSALLVKRGMQPYAETPSAYKLRLTEVYSEFTSGSKVAVGEDQLFKLEDGRTGTIRRYVALASEAAGLAAAIGDVTSGEACSDVKVNKQGVGAEIIETYISAGQLSQSDSTSNNGALLMRTLVHFNEVPSTPSGYVLVDTDVKGPEGVETYTYRFAKGVGEISRDTDRGQNGTTTDGSVGVTRLNITHLTAPSASEPTWASVSGYVQVSVNKAERDGHMVWSAVYAKGAGEVKTDVSTRSLGKLKIYSITALGAAPSAPTATIGGTVTLFDTSVRKEGGFSVYDYRWAEAMPDGQTGISVSARADGSLVYTVTELGAAVDTPAYPGSGTAYLVDLDNNTSEGHMVNRATYIKPPPDVTLKKPHVFDMPGTAQFETTGSGHNLLLSPSKRRIIQANEEVSYSTSQLSTSHWQLLFGCYINASFVREGETKGESQQQAFSNYVSAGDTATGSNPDEYNGVIMESYSATIEASSPTSRPSGSTVIAPPDNEIYLTAIDGTTVYRRTLLRYTF